MSSHQQAVIRRPPVRPTVRFPGQVVIAPDRYHPLKLRPYLIYEVDGDMAYVAELSHSQQGVWNTSELGGGTYLALRHFSNGDWLPHWISLQGLTSYAYQLSEEAREGALDAIAVGLNSQ